MLRLETELVCSEGKVVCFLRPVQGKQRLGKIDAALERGGIFLAVDVNCGARIVLDIFPFLELDAGYGAVREEGRIVWVLGDSGGRMKSAFEV